MAEWPTGQNPAFDKVVPILLNNLKQMFPDLAAAASRPMALRVSDMIFERRVYEVAKKHNMLPSQKYLGSLAAAYRDNSE